MQLTNNGMVFDPEKYAVVWDPAWGVYDLIIKNTQDTDAVQYRCNLGQSAKEAYAQLVVLESETECTEYPDFTDLREGDDIRLDCSVRYWGFYGPSMIFEDKSGTDLNAIPVSEPNAVRYYYQIRGITPLDQGKSFTVTTYFEPLPGGFIPDNEVGPPERIYSHVTPSDTFTFKSHELNILYPVRDMTIDPYKSEFTVGETMSCIASGNPNPAISWYDENGDFIQNGQNVALTSGMAGLRNFTCLAMNTIDGIEYTVNISIFFTLTVHSESCDTTSSESQCNAGEICTDNVCGTAVECSTGPECSLVGLPPNCRSGYCQPTSCTATGQCVHGTTCSEVLGVCVSRIKYTVIEGTSTLVLPTAEPATPGTYIQIVWRKGNPPAQICTYLSDLRPDVVYQGEYCDGSDSCSTSSRGRLDINSGELTINDLDYRDSDFYYYDFQADIPDNSASYELQVDVRASECLQCIYAFSVSLFDSVEINESPLVFNDVLTNVREIYSVNTGIFSVPVAGLYFLQTTIVSTADTTGFNVRIMRNGEHICKGFTEQTGSHTASGTAIVHLVPGDEIFVNSGNAASGDKARGSGMSSFNGYIIQQFN